MNINFYNPLLKYLASGSLLLSASNPVFATALPPVTPAVIKPVVVQKQVSKPAPKAPALTPVIQQIIAKPNVAPTDLPSPTKNVGPRVVKPNVDTKALPNQTNNKVSTLTPFTPTRNVAGPIENPTLTKGALGGSTSGPTDSSGFIADQPTKN